MKIHHILSILLLSAGLFSCTRFQEPDFFSEKRPEIYPDYTDLVIPVNIAPLNFKIQIPGDKYQIAIGLIGEEPSILLQNKHPIADIPQSDWNNLLSRGSGKHFYFRLSIQKNGKWTQYKDIINRISTDSIDQYLVYRLLYPGYELWNEMGIYQRDLNNFEQAPVMENRDFNHQCVNCHSFSDHSSRNMMVHIRGKQGGTIIYHNGKAEKVDPKPDGFKNGATYPAWHPGRQFIAFSTNEIQQFFHISGKKPIEVADLSADLMVYNIMTHEAVTDSIVCNNLYYETFPTWSPDGKALYFCRAKAMTESNALDSIRYDLYKVRFDEKTMRIDSLQIVVNASAQGKSVSFPVVSPDGRYLMFTMSDYGNFSIWHPESDLWILDLTTGETRNLNEVNSKDVDSWHCWSSTGKWFVFSSKRLDGGWARPYFSHFDTKTGRASKPFVLPQRDPEYYDSFMFTFNRPELIQDKIDYGKELIEAIKQIPGKTTLHRR